MITGPPRGSVVMDNTMRKSNYSLLAALVALLAAALWYCASVWGSTAPMPGYRNVIMAAGAILALVIGFGLMSLEFYSHREGHDMAARSNRDARSE